MTTPETVFPILQNFHGTEPLKQLFWVELNYNRDNTPINDLPESTANLVTETPLVLATGAKDNDFHIIYVQLKTEKLRRTDERQIIAHLQTRYPDALYVFSNFAQKRWHFINVKFTREKQEKTEQQRETDLKQRNLFRRITIGPDERLRTAAERIAMLDLEEIDKRDTLWDSRELLTALEIRKQHEEAFNVEAVTKAFFEDYKRVFRELQDELCEQTDDEKWAHDYAQQFLSRCLFLYFIQRKRWLGDDIEFLRTFWETYQNESQNKNTFVEKWLNVLFFQAFNDRPCNGYRYIPSKVRDILQLAPYLNGGLFRENDLDTGYIINISDDLWQDIFTFFEQYNFTIAEDTPLDQEVAVDPEMIGKVYESLVSVEDEERSDAGIFYTPRVEIDLMCRIALVDNLANHIGTKDDKHRFYEALFAFEPEEKREADAKLTDFWEEIYKHLTEITILDPACGSGSFLVGMLHVLDDVRERAEKHLGVNRESSFERRKELIGKNLYGVDVKRWACKVAELRLWLVLIIDADFDTAELTVRKQNEPLLPDFSFNIRHGDSIVQDIGGMNLAPTRSLGNNVPRDIQHKIENHKIEKRKFYHSEEGRRYTEKEDGEEAERSIFRELLQSYDTQLSKDIRIVKAWLEDPAEQLTLDGIQSATTQQLKIETRRKREELARHEENRRQVQRAREALASKATPPFVWDMAFVEIFSQREGFDIVVENPPYIRQEDIRDLMLPREEAKTPANKKVYKAKLARAVYQAHRDFFGYQEKKDIKPDKPEAAVKNKLSGQSDLYLYFYFHGLSLLNPKGSFCTITSNSWLDVGYGKNLQEFLLKQCYLKMVLDNSAKRSFATADINTVICLISAPNRTQELCLKHIARFVKFTVPFEAILDAVIFYEIETASARDSSPEHHIHPLPQKSLLVNGNDENAKYTGDKWGGKYLRAPDIYWTVLEKGMDKLVRLGDIAEVRRGFTTGVNKFFYFDDERIQEWGIETEFLKPIIKSPRECKSICVDPNQLRFKLFMCHLDKASLAGTAALDYIEWGESQGFDQRPSCRGRARWWDLGKQPSFDWLILRFRDKRNWTPVNETQSLLASDVVFTGTLYNRNTIKSANAVANSTLAVLISEIYGRVNLGDGLLTTYGPEIMKFDLISPDWIDIQSGQSLNQAFELMKQREILSIFDEIHQSDRRALDAIIFDALNFTQGERDEVYEAVIQLVTNRVEKAKNK